MGKKQNWGWEEEGEKEEEGWKRGAEGIHIKKDVQLLVCIIQVYSSRV